MSEIRDSIARDFSPRYDVLVRKRASQLQYIVAAPALLFTATMTAALFGVSDTRLAPPPHPSTTNTVLVGSRQTVVQSPKALPEISERAGQQASILVVGDVMLGRYVETLMKKNGISYPFARLGGLLRGHDIVLGNLEGPIDSTHTQTPDDSLLFSFDPNVANILREQGFTVLSLANNHGLDQGAQGVEDTRLLLRDAGIEPLGHPREIDRNDVVVKNISGQTIVLLGLHAIQPSFDLDGAVSLVQKFKQEHPSSFLLATPHWGNEYQTHSSARQQTIAHALIDAGADFIIGHHPHVVQDVEEYKGRMIFYSLGNFIFDQYFSAETQEGLAVRIVVSSQVVRFELLPLVSEKSQPRPMTQEERSVFLTSLAARSSGSIRGDIVSGELVRARE